MPKIQMREKAIRIASEVQLVSKQGHSQRDRPNIQQCGKLPTATDRPLPWTIDEKIRFTESGETKYCSAHLQLAGNNLASPCVPLRAETVPAQDQARHTSQVI